MREFRYAVIGGGGIGSAAAYWLSRRAPGDVVCLEQWHPGHRFGASEDHSRIIRLGYHSSAYTALTRDAYAAWGVLEEDSGVPLVHRTGMVNLARPGTEGACIIDAYVEAMREHDIGFERLDAAEVARRWPQFRLRGEHSALFQPDGGILDIRKATAAHLALARARGATVLADARVRSIRPTASGVELETAAGAIRAEQVIICAGAWTPGLLDGLGIHWPIRLTQEQVTYYATPNLRAFAPERFPIWIWHGNEEYYGFPIHGEVAWNRLQSREIEPFVNVGREEVESVLERLKAAKGTQEFRVGEIFLSSTPETAAETRANASRIVQQLRQGASFAAYARQFSEASTAAVGGDLGWVRAEQLPEPLAQAAQSAAVGTVTDPIPVPGGFSVILVQDTRQLLTADPRDAVLSLKQMTISFPAGMKEAEAQPLITRLSQTAQSMGGCGGAEEAAAKIGAEVISSDQVRARDLPPALQNTLLAMSIGQSTPPFGTFEQGVRVLVLCGRDDSEVSTEPSFQQVYAQLEEQRVNMRARRYLRDLRRDAVVDYR